MILAVPNVAEGRDFGRLGRLVEAVEAGPVELLDWSSDLDHNRSVFTLAGEGPQTANAVATIAAALSGGAGIGEWEGIHPTVGLLDVAPFVWLESETEGEAQAAAMLAAERLGEAGIPVFLYGDLASSPERAERAWFRRGGPDELGRRMESGELPSDFGPDLPHPVMGATLVTARSPLVAFNIELEGGEPGLAERIAAGLRESGGGPRGLRAIGLELSTGRGQVSMNVGEPSEGSLGEIAQLVAERARAGGGVAVEAELIGLAPEAALLDYPDTVPIREFDPDLKVIERRLAQKGEGPTNPA
ncbi:MAG: glutamate formiminotransferase [Solirubrobacterales bacterium]